jgi:hypothetical protein
MNQTFETNNGNIKLDANMESNRDSFNQITKLQQSIGKEIDEVFNEISFNRPKRALIGGVGRLGHFMFGLLSEHEEDKINDKIYDLNQNEIHLHTQIDHSVSYINNVEQGVVNNTHHIAEIIDEFNLKIKNITSYIIGNSAAVDFKLSEISHALELSRIINNMYTAFLNQKDSITRFRSGIESALHNKLSTFLVSNDLFYEYLGKIIMKLPESFNFVLPLNRQNINVIRNSAVVTFKRVNDFFRLYISIVIINARDIFDKYVIVSVPVYNRELNVNENYNLPSLLYIDKDKKLLYTVFLRYNII